MPNFESLVAYCGLYCGDCKIRKNEIADLAKQLMDKLDESHFEREAAGLAQMVDEMKALAHYGEFHDVLCALDKYRCSAACKQGGGTKTCPIRKCCMEKRIEGCWICPEFEQCQTLAWLRPVNGDANLKNIRIIKSRGIYAFLSGPKYWSAES